VVVVNLGDDEVSVPLDDGGGSQRVRAMLWHSPAGAVLHGDEVVLPPHAACLVR
jgi:hypothetical protein